MKNIRIIALLSNFFMKKVSSSSNISVASLVSRGTSRRSAKKATKKIVQQISEKMMKVM